MKRRNFLSETAAAATTLMLTGGAAFAQRVPPVEGKDFVRLPKDQPTTSPGKVEVLEFFSYACPHCNAFEPDLEAWEHRLPSDAVLKRVPVPFLMNAPLFQRTYYTLDTMGLVDKMQAKIFAAVHVEHARMNSPEDVAAVVARNGGDGNAFLSTFRTPSVELAANRARKMTADYNIDSVPSLVVQGRYVTSPAQAGGQKQALWAVDGLIARARKEQ
jgi:thiol:disulfide interchange protein DsbA